MGWAAKQYLDMAGYEIVMVPVWHDNNNNGRIDSGEIVLEPQIRKKEKQQN